MVTQIAVVRSPLRLFHLDSLIGRLMWNRVGAMTAPAAVDRATTIRVLAEQFHAALHIVEASSAGEV